MIYFLLFFLLGWFGWWAYKIYLAWPVIIATAWAMSDVMDEMTLSEAAKFSLLGRYDSKH